MQTPPSPAIDVDKRRHLESPLWLLATTEKSGRLSAKDRDRISMGLFPRRAARSGHASVKLTLRLPCDIARKSGECMGVRMRPQPVGLNSEAYSAIRFTPCRMADYASG
jgi:hypothetical protein